MCNSNDTILEKIAKKSHSYNGFAFNVTRSFLDTYDPICRIEKCYVCQLQSDINDISLFSYYIIVNYHYCQYHNLFTASVVCIVFLYYRLVN